MDIKVHVKFAKGSSQKVGRVINLIRGKGAEASLNILSFVSAGPAAAVRKLVESAMARAKQSNIGPANLFIKEIYVNQGPAMKRSKAGSRGRVKPIKRRTFHLTLTIGEKGEK